MKSNQFKKTAIAAAFTAAGLLPATAAHAGGTITWGEDKSVSLGLGMRSSFSSVEGGAANGSRAENIGLDSVRIYMGGSLNKYIKGTFNTEKNGDTITLLDGYAQFEFMDEFNVWVGRMLPPSDRSNLDGPYYLSNWVYPTAPYYPAIFAGRDDGATVWGKMLDKKLVYALGVFKGHNRAAGASNQSSSLLWAGRIAYNFLDAEPNPAYYTSSTYYGSVDVLTLAFAGQYQKNGVGTALLPGDYTEWNADLLFEKKLDFGVVTLEGAYYDVSTQGVVDTVLPGTNTGGITAGDAFLVSGAYMFPEKVGWGFVQPYGRYQELDPDVGLKTKQYDIGANYVIDGHNARISLDYTAAKVGTGSYKDSFIIGVQLQF
ncbi:MAG: porin [Thiobacillus sp.]|nr:porin [Thiobacillus sp.]